MISSGGLTHRLDRLEKAGLIRREKSQQDGRSRTVALTEAGTARVAGGRARPSALMSLAARKALIDRTGFDPLSSS